ncbi:MAG: hypothetical protein KIT16_24390 [Rhodospirillaceae bacterium]|nr:hypothetical protein [Rhodospirillaceae bacterium]
MADGSPRRDMEQLEQARARLDRALDRLDAAQSALEERVRVLKAAVAQDTEWQAVIGAVEEVQRENQALSEREERIRAQLDRAIERLAALLEGDAGEAA